MKLLPSLLLAPTLALSAATGSVILLDGTPIAGAVIKSPTDSVTTSATGSFALGRTSGISSRSSKSISVTSHLVVENGRPRLSFAGMDIAGRARSSAIARQNLSRTGSSFTARSTGTPDTLKVYWKGKRLTVLPVTSDTTVTFRIDTAWKDDAGIPWNPSIAYGSLYDARDGQTYRTVTIGSQTWMAENLGFAADPGIASWIYRDSSRYGERYGRLYTWAGALNLPASCNRAVCSTQVASLQGACPTGWHVPRNADWDILRNLVEAQADIGTGRAARALKSRNGWHSAGGGDDRFGFRILAAGWISTGNSRMADTSTYLRAADERESDISWDVNVLSSAIVEPLYAYYYYKWQGFSLRCIKD